MTINEKSKIIFNENYVGAIATVNQDGSPWITPLHMATDDEYVYWFSEETEVHSQNLVRDPRVSLTLYKPDGGAHKQGVYVNGQAEVVAEAERPAARELLVERLGFSLSCFDTGAAYRVPLGQVDHEKSSGNCWYFSSTDD